MAFDIKEIGQIDAEDLGPFGVAGQSRMGANCLARRTHMWLKSGRFGAQKGHGRASPGADLGAQKIWLCLGLHLGRAGWGAQNRSSKSTPRLPAAKSAFGEDPRSQWADMRGQSDANVEGICATQSRPHFRLQCLRLRFGATYEPAFESA